MKAVVVGGGAVGAGWAARFLLMGWDVTVADPEPSTLQRVERVLANARRALPGLFDVALPQEGQLTIAPSVAEAVATSEWVVEALPEQLELKHRIYAETQEAAPRAIIASSTSRFKPSELQKGALDPTRILVTHPFDPVYLLPLVEVVSSSANSTEVVERTEAVLNGIGMYPLHIRKEVDAHIAGRFLEAVWREALRLVKDDIATTEEVDTAIRYGFGLCWAQMGPFEACRVAGGEAGMRHSIRQFGSGRVEQRDAPELTEALIKTIAAQSDAQSKGLSVQKLERIRDANLVGIMRSLRGNGGMNVGWGAGQLLRDHDARLLGAELPDLSKMIPTLSRSVPLDWVDYNGHMNEARYLQAFGDATDRFMELIGCDADYIATGGSFFTAETHIRHLDEVHVGERIEVFTQLLAAAGKKMHLWHEMRVEDKLKATGEHILIHVSLETRRASAPGDVIAQSLEEIWAGHKDLQKPEAAGRYVGQGR